MNVWFWCSHFCTWFLDFGFFWMLGVGWNLAVVDVENLVIGNLVVCAFRVLFCLCSFHPSTVIVSFGVLDGFYLANVVPFWMPFSLVYLFCLLIKTCSISFIFIGLLDTNFSLLWLSIYLLKRALSDWFCVHVLLASGIVYMNLGLLVEKVFLLTWTSPCIFSIMCLVLRLWIDYPFFLRRMQLASRVSRGIRVWHLDNSSYLPNHRCVGQKWHQLNSPICSIVVLEGREWWHWVAQRLIVRVGHGFTINGFRLVLCSSSLFFCSFDLWTLVHLVDHQRMHGCHYGILLTLSNNVFPLSFIAVRFANCLNI